MENFETFKDHDLLLAFVIRSGFTSERTTFFTESNSPQQMGYLNFSEGHIIDPHEHKISERIIDIAQEVLYVQSGKVRVFLFNSKRKLVASVVLGKSDFIFLASGGHGFQFIEKTELIEIKQGPYMGRTADKEVFSNPEFSQKVGL